MNMNTELLDDTLDENFEETDSEDYNEKESEMEELETEVIEDIEKWADDGDLKKIPFKGNPGPDATCDIRLIKLKPVLKQHGGYFGLNFIILNHGQMTRTTHDLPAPLLAHDDRFTVHQAHMNGGSSVESGFEPGTLRCQSRDLTTTPP
ncbi:hypothetical protein AVEN_177504-1 [Araneus ventricosus]|uniref:Uncharacterized protein n=1 Tax=Araneus ventricosus TaxID=182803 RepID=A0A4Y2D0L2_ARAVE|nr:hypothetical protein AVEN_177504-1 [Araneus ventricosus]